MSDTSPSAPREKPRLPTSNKDRLARYGAAASAFVAFASLGISCASYREQKHQFNQVQAEKLAVTLVPREYDPVRITRINFGPDGRVVIVPWKLTLSNTGQQRLSITSYEISTGERPGQKLYTGLDSGLFDDKTELVKLPITLEPGDSKMFTISMGMLVSKEVGDALLPAAEASTGFVMKPALVLAKQDLDLHGNKVAYAEFPNGSQLTMLTNHAGQVFWFVARTGRNNVFVGSGHSIAPSPELARLNFVDR